MLLLVGVAAFAAACGAGDNRLDPGDLELRDLLGISPEAADRWDPTQRAAARRVLAEHLASVESGAPLRLALASDVRSADDRVARALGTLDVARAREGDGALALVRVGADGDAVARRASAGARGTAGVIAPSGIELRLAEGWDHAAWGHLPARGIDVLAALAEDAGHERGPVVVAPAPRLAVIAAYVDGNAARLLVNPVLLAALEPADAATGAVAVVAPAGDVGAAGDNAARAAEASGTRGAAGETHAGAGNPYSFYGSVAECAFAERARCESCLSASNCVPETDASSGNTECETLAANDGRGYYLFCANLALAITAVAQCTAVDASGCPRDVHAATSLSTLGNNANFVDDATCSAALDGCLAKIFGAPPEPFPGVDAGVTPPRPPRQTDVSCNDSCSNNNCELAPSCGAGPSCGNSFSCDSSCSSSNTQSGCSCDNDTGGGGGGGCGGGGGGGGDSCGGGDSGGSCGGGDSGGSCGGGDGGGGGCGGSSGSSGGSCGGGGGGGGCGDSGGGGGCGGSSGGGGGCSGGGGGGCGGGGGGGGCSGGGGGSSGCNAARRDPPASAGLVMSLVWGLLPVPFAALARRKTRPRAPRREPAQPITAPSTDLADFERVEAEAETEVVS
ncbi:MAG: hypothetical protein KF773_16440 [Deltaproteobacteria bacterium]|nr:hypothetical protein [Deltaproteobacteria bacterium]